MFRIVNRTAFEVALVTAHHPDGMDRGVVVVKASYDFGRAPELVLCQAQQAVRLADEHHGDPHETSVRAEAETAPGKLGTDVMMVGDVVAPAGTTCLDLSLEAGPLTHQVRIWGDRVWQRHDKGHRPGPPQPFERMPLRYERAFGGCDRRSTTSVHCDERNPLGVGFLDASNGNDAADRPLPNIEDLESPLSDPFGRPPLAGFGVIGRSWKPRRDWAGGDSGKVDPRFFSAAPMALQHSAHFVGNEPIRIRGVAPRETIAFALPRHPLVLEASVARERSEQRMALDTVFIDLDARRLELVYRASVICPRSLWHLEWVRISEPA
jgi:hypothetical protein